MTSSQNIDLVSVVVAAKNECEHIEASLTSIATQEGVRFEIVFVDDNSEDNTIDIAGNLAAFYTSIRIFRNPKQGKCAAFNFGVTQARGRFTCIFAGDDIMPPGSLEQRYHAIAGKSDDLPTVGLSKLITMSTDRRYDGHIVPKARGRGSTSGVSPLMNRRALDIIFPTPEHLPNEDTWMELFILHMPKWTIVHSDIICCRWRMHVGNSINYNAPFEVYSQKIAKRMEAIWLFIKKHDGELEEAQRALVHAKRDLEIARRNGQWWTVLRTKAPLINRLRVFSMTTPVAYEIRRRLYGLLSGW